MKRIDEFLKKLDDLCNEFNDLPSQDIADELEYKAVQFQRQAEYDD
jgi:hypothetical protein